MRALPSPGLALPGLALLAGLFAGAPALAEPTVSGDFQTDLLACDGADAHVDGNSNRLVFHGACRSLTVTGSNNIVEIELVPGGRIFLTGTANHVTFAPVDPPPELDWEGEGNEVEPGPPGAASAALAPPVPDAPPPPASLAPPSVPPGLLKLSGDDTTLEADCAGRRVMIEGSRSVYHLVGGCSSIVVDGSENRIRAELQPGAHVVLAGADVTLDYVLTAAGPPPTITVSGAGSQARAFSHPATAP
jgi:hypothetical protein